MLYYGECGENDSVPTLENLSNKIAIADIRELKTDKVSYEILPTNLIN